MKPKAMGLVPAVSSRVALAVSTPFVDPLYDTRAVEATLDELARRIGVEGRPVTPQELVQQLLVEGTTFEDVASEGGIWLDAAAPAPPRIGTTTLELGAARFEGEPDEYPFHFQPYPSLQYADGRGANLPWLQELPDPASSSIWDLPIEIDPKTAAKLQLANGDIARVKSPYGVLEAPVYVHPGAIPGVVSMAVGEGHAHYGRYASGRGANPLSILAPVWETSTRSLALGATRVRLARAGGPRGWTQFSTQDRQERLFDRR